MAALARTIPMLRTSEPSISPSMKPKMCSMRHLSLDIDQCSHEIGSMSTLLISSILENTNSDIDKMYRKLLYKLCESIASVDGVIAIEEKEWLEEIARLDDEDATNDIEINEL